MTAPPHSATISSGPVRRRRKGEVTAERILDAAESLFAEHGFAGTTLRDVAEGTGLAIPSLYNHFPSKESLYAAVLERGIGPVLEALSETAASDEDPRQTSGRVIARVSEVLTERPALARLVQHETLAGGRHLTPILRDWMAPTFERAREMVEANPGAARWSDAQIPLLVLGMFNMVVGYFAIAPFYRELSGVDLMSEPVLAEQTRFLTHLADTLFAEGATLPSDVDGHERS